MSESISMQPEQGPSVDINEVGRFATNAAAGEWNDTSDTDVRTVEAATFKDTKTECTEDDPLTNGTGCDC